MKNGQYSSTKITKNCSCEIYPIKSHVLFTHAGKILHPHNWPPIMWTENEIAYIDESESMFHRPSVQRFCISRGTNTRFQRFAEWNHGCLGEKTSVNSSKITCYAHCPDVFEDIKPFTTTRWNTFLKSVVIRKALVGNQANVAKAFLLYSSDTVQNEMTATKHKWALPPTAVHTHRL